MSAKPMPPLTPEQKRMHEADAKFHARRSGFIVRAALMFNVSCAEVTQAQYMAAVERTQQDTVPTTAGAAK